MIIEEIIPLLPIIGFELIFSKILKILDIKLSIAEKIIYSLVFFSSLLIIPWSVAGLQKYTIFFQLWPIIFGLIGIIVVGIQFYRNYGKIILWLENPKPVLSDLSNKIGGFKSSNAIILLIISLLFIGYTLFNLILPFRDFDAIWMYIPDAMWYYRTNYIPQFDPLNFRLSTKEPFVCLVFTFSLYLTGSLNIKFIPMLFIIGWSLTVYVFIEKIWKDLNKSLVGVLLFLVSPFIYYIMNFWVYYQEIYVSFFYSVSLLAIFSFFQSEQLTNLKEKNKLQAFYIVLGSFSLALSLLSKLSGWSLLFIVILIYPFSKKSRIMQTVLIAFISIFLIVKVSIDYYVGIGIIILAYSGLIIGLIWKHRDSDNQTIYSSNRMSFVGILIMPLGVVVGGFWLIDTFNKFHQYATSTVDLYLIITNLKIKYVFQGTPLNSSHFLLESAHSADFFSIVFYLLVGNMFVLFWILPKIRVIFDDQVKFFVLWILGFFNLWLTYQGFSSIRYLSVILVPIIIVVTHGFFKLYQDLTEKSGPIPISVVFLACFLSFASFYFPISLNILTNGLNTSSINDQFLLSAYNYYKNSILYLLLALIISISFIIIIKLHKKNIIRFRMPKVQLLKIVKVIALVLILFVPFFIPSFVFVSSDENINQFNATFVYYQRPAYTEVVNALLNENSPSSGVIDINFPGLPIYLNQPSLDLFDQAGNVKSIFSSNITALLEMLQEPLSYIKTNYNISINPNALPTGFSFDYIIIPNFGNNFYPFYVRNFYNQSFIFPLLFQKSLFQLIYKNNEFLVFKRIYTVPFFSGIVNGYLTSGNTKISLLGMVQSSSQFLRNMSLQILCSLPEAIGSQVTINTTINLLENNIPVSINSTQNLDLKNSSTMFSIPIPLSVNLPNRNSFSIENINLKILINTKNTYLVRNYSLVSPENNLTVNYNPKNNYWSISTGLGLQPI